jgi:ATP-binding cassette subfamily B protein
LFHSRLVYYFVRFRTRYICGFVALVAASFVVMLPPIVVRDAIDAIDEGTTSTELVGFVGLIFALAIVESSLRFGSRMLVSGTSRKVEYELRNDLAAHLMRLDQSYYLKQQTGDLMARCTNDLQRVRDLVGPASLDIARAVLLMVIGFAFMLSIDVRLALIALAYFPVVAVLMVRFRETVENKYRAVQDQFGVLSNRVQENISGIRAIKAYAQEGSESDTFARENEELMRRTMSWAFYMGAFWPLMIFVAGFSVALVLWFGGRDVVAGRLTVGEFVQFNAYLAILAGALMPLGWTATMFQQGVASMRRVAEVLAAEPQINDPARATPLPEPRGDVEFRNVTFGYGSESVLRDVSFAVPAGRTVALVGATGAGKTSLVGLLVRLYDPWEGQVLLDGVDVRDLSLQELRSLVGFVPQETFLFSDSLEENIALARDHWTEAEIAYAVNTSQLVNDLPQLSFGLETVLGERGVTLSGGQKQRTALARALLKDPPVVVLDDALSHVDTHTEEEILHRLHDFMKDRTTILIAHRTSTLRSADYIVALEDGRIVEQGTHDELLGIDGVYARFYRRQLLVEQIEEAPGAGSDNGARANGGAE